MRQILVSILLLSFQTFANSLEVSVEPLGITGKEHESLKNRILAYPNVQSLLSGQNFRVLSLDLMDPTSVNSQYLLSVFNYQEDRHYEISGPVNMSTLPQITEAFADTPATTDEFDDAVKVLMRDPEFGQQLKENSLKTYEPMPTTSRFTNPKKRRGTRLINVGVMSTSQPKLNEIVGVDLYRKKVIRFPLRAPPGSVAVEDTCGLPDANQRPTRKGTQGSAKVEIKRGNDILWTFTVVRPAASSGRDGSGLEIRDLHYRLRKVLTRAHTPILNVQYEGDKCGPFRDWTYSENAFTAYGFEKAPGILVSGYSPTTIFDNQIDQGNFQGIAIFVGSEKVTLITELSAGWYRYVSKFELHNDGTIKPFFEFSAVENSCVCFSHNHHVYWRLDFDIGEGGNSVQVSNGQSFRPIDTETTHTKGPDHRSWRVINPQQGFGYDLVPGPNDGASDSYSIADVWLLRFSNNQIDDSQVKDSTAAGLNSFVNGGALTGTDVVLWYSGHFIHSHGPAETTPSIVGPTLSPVSWP